MKCKIPSINEFVKERNETLFSLDKEKIKIYAKKYQIVMPDNDMIFWASVYKAIMAIESAPKELKGKAAKWLSENGFSTSCSLRGVFDNIECVMRGEHNERQ